MLSFLFLMSAVFATTEIKGPIIGRSQEEIMVILRHKDKKVFQNFLNDTPDIFTQKYENGDTILHLAVKIGKVELVKLLLDKWIDVNVKNDQGMTALHIAADACSDTIVDVLIDAKADVNLTDSLGNTSLHYAALRKNLVICRALGRANADLNIQNQEGNTALHLASTVEGYEICRLLESMGARTDLKNQNGNTAENERFGLGTKVTALFLVVGLVSIPFIIYKIIF